eukprot:SAG31_NODE_2159_length_6302_cov_9.311140_7_plen_99_part_00
MKLFRNTEDVGETQWYPQTRFPAATYASREAAMSLSCNSWYWNTKMSMDLSTAWAGQLITASVRIPGQRCDTNARIQLASRCYHSKAAVWTRSVTFLI